MDSIVPFVTLQLHCKNDEKNRHFTVRYAKIINSECPKVFVHVCICEKERNAFFNT